MQLLGHKNINITLVYTQLVDFGNDEYMVKVAHNIDEDKQLIEAGFEYVTEEKVSRFTGNANNPYKKVSVVWGVC